MKRTVLLLTALAAFCSVSVPSFGCDYAFWRKFGGTRLYRHKDGSSYFFLIRKKHVTVAGAPHAYHPRDAGKTCPPSDGSKPFGDACPRAAWFPTKKGTPPAWRGALAADPGDSAKPYIKKDGFYLSKTALARKDSAETDSDAYADPYKVPYIALPAGEFLNAKGTGAVGDLGVAWNLSNGVSSPFIVADKSPSGAPLGYASPAMYRALGGKGASAVKDRSGLADGDVVLFAVFPGTRTGADVGFPPDRAKMRAATLDKAKGLLESAKSCVK